MLAILEWCVGHKTHVGPDGVFSRAIMDWLQSHTNHVEPDAFVYQTILGWCVVYYKMLGQGGACKGSYGILSPILAPGCNFDGGHLGLARGP